LLSATDSAGFVLFFFLLLNTSQAIRPIAPRPPMTAPTAIPALAPVLRESDELESDWPFVPDAGSDVEVLSAELAPSSVEEAASEVEVSSPAVVVESVTVVNVEELSSESQVPNSLWQLSKCKCQ